MAVNIIYRMPNLKEIRPILFGYTHSIVFTLISIGFYYKALLRLEFDSIIIPICIVAGFLFGWVTGYLYNMLLSWSVKIIFVIRKRKNVLFGYKSNNKIQIIKSPKPNEEVKIPAGLQARKIYDSKITPNPTHPYTIAFIASPCYIDSTGAPQNDPIIKDERFFYTSVARALDSLDNDEVLGHPDIWSRTRIVTMFYNPELTAPNEKYAFVGESSFVYGEPLVGVDDIVSPITSLDKYYNSQGVVDINDLLKFEHDFINYRGDLADLFIEEKDTNSQKNEIKKIFEEIDVIYFLTANKKYIRSSARPSEGIVNPFGTEKSYFFNDLIKIKVEKLSQIPGMVALNTLYARQKTIIHEFAHAMAHDENGAIVDEYYDTIYNSQIFSVNALRKGIGRIEVPKEFITYHPDRSHKVQFLSDRDHPSAQENWKQYFPQREAKYIGCTMDRPIGDYQFDKLLSAFMYDRLISKVTR